MAVRTPAATATLPVVFTPVTTSLTALPTFFTFSTPTPNNSLPFSRTPLTFFFGIFLKNEITLSRIDFPSGEFFKRFISANIFDLVSVILSSLRFSIAFFLYSLFNVSSCPCIVHSFSNSGLNCGASLETKVPGFTFLVTTSPSSVVTGASLTPFLYLLFPFSAFSVITLFIICAFLNSASFINSFTTSISACLVNSNFSIASALCFGVKPFCFLTTLIWSS